MSFQCVLDHLRSEMQTTSRPVSHQSHAITTFDISLTGSFACTEAECFPSIDDLNALLRLGELHENVHGNLEILVQHLKKSHDRPFVFCEESLHVSNAKLIDCVCSMCRSLALHSICQSSCYSWLAFMQHTNSKRFCLCDEPREFIFPMLRTPAQKTSLTR